MDGSLTSNKMHVAIIMDGNGRWATKRGLDRLKGHARGVERVKEVVKASPDLGVTHLTLFAFSTENWKRSEREVLGLMSLFRRYIRSESASLYEKGVRVRFIGRRDGLDVKLLDLMDGLEDRTKDCNVLHLTVAINYGGRDEIVRAVKKVAERAAAGHLDPHEVTEDMVGRLMDTATLPDPDLVMRTSGEMRVSNFLPWQSVYSEFLFEETAWPDFTAQDFEAALDSFRARDRRFGAVKVK